VHVKACIDRVISAQEQAKNSRQRPSAPKQPNKTAQTTNNIFMPDTNLEL
jgi:hypothetical protein